MKKRAAVELVASLLVSNLVRALSCWFPLLLGQRDVDSFSHSSV